MYVLCGIPKFSVISFVVWSKTREIPLVLTWALPFCHWADWCPYPRCGFYYHSTHKCYFSYLYLVGALAHVCSMWPWPTSGTEVVSVDNPFLKWSFLPQAEHCICGRPVPVISGLKCRGWNSATIATGAWLWLCFMLIPFMSSFPYLPYPFFVVGASCLIVYTTCIFWSVMMGQSCTCTCIAC